MTIQSAQWDTFNPYVYVANNYQTIHDEDRVILDVILPYIRRNISQSCRVLDIGTGPNLYPVIALLPYSRRIDCLEYSRSNVRYLLDQIHRPAEYWHRFHRYMRHFGDQYVFPLHPVLTEKVCVRQGDIFTYSQADYDVVTMFFCAESITSQRNRFIAACKKSMSYLRNGGLYIAVFMEQSKGYEIDRVQFPAYPTNTEELSGIFEPLCTKLSVTKIPKSTKPLREGYGGMVLITGIRKEIL